MFADLDWIFRVSWTHIMWIFYSQTQKIAKYVRNIMRSYLPCRGRGMRWLGPFWSLVIHSGFTNMFQIKTFLPKLKTSDSTRKPYVDPFSHRRGRDGVIGCIRILIGSFQFPEYIPCENSLPKLKNSQINLYNHHGGLFTPQLGWGWDDRLRLDLKWFVRVFQTFFSSKFFLNPKNSESTQKIIRYGSFPHRRSGDGVIGWIRSQIV